LGLEETNIWIWSKSATLQQNNNNLKCSIVIIVIMQDP
jgi:hypothetical protein